MSADLTCRYLGLELSGPIIASSSPLTGEVDTALALQDAGAAAIVLPSLFAEEVEDEEVLAADLMETGEEFAEFNSAPLPAENLTDLGPERHVRRVADTKAALQVPVIASVNATRPGSWERYSSMLVDAGADALELNLYAVAADTTVSAAEVEENYLRVIEAVRRAVEVPIALKLSPYFSSLSNFAPRAVEAGVNGLILFNRFYGADIDLDGLELTPRLSLSTSEELRLPLRWIGILRAQLPQISLAATSGVHTGADVAKALLVGADVACTASAVLHGGPGQVKAMLAELTAWLAEHDYESIEQLRGSMSAASVPNASEFERAQYMKVITSR